MPTVQPFPAGGYRFIIHQFQYSGGVAAEPGFRIEHARFARPLPLAEGFDAIEAYLAGIGRSPTAFCACELRSPTQFSDAGFVAFNRHYVERLAGWGIFRDGAQKVPPQRRISQTAWRMLIPPYRMDPGLAHDHAGEDVRLQHDEHAHQTGKRN
jgi:hypothetical protein